MGIPEKNVLRKLHAAQNALGRLKLQETTDEDCDAFYRNFYRLWTETREWYIEYVARAVITTTVTALQPVLRKLRLHYIVFDEPSQMVEASTVAVLGKFFDSLPKVLLVGSTPFQKSCW